LDTEARYAEYLSNYPKAVVLLTRAFETNPQSPYIAIRLSKKLANEGNHEQALSVLKQCADRNPGDKHVNFAIADVMERYSAGSRAEIGHHLRRSFTDGDSNFAAQFKYARHLFIDGELKESMRLFAGLREAKVSPLIKREFRGHVMDGNSKKRFAGMIARIELGYGFIKRDGALDDVFADPRGTDESTWGKIRKGERVTFFLSFNYLGPVAVDLKSE